MRFYLLLCLSFLSSQANAIEMSQDDKSNKVENISQLKILPLANEDRFAIYYNFADGPLRAALKDAMVKHFQKFGVVCLSDDSTLSEKQRESKYRPGGMVIDIFACQIVEEKNLSSTNLTELPVIEIAMKVVGGVEVLQNGSKFPGTVWEKEKYIGVVPEKNELINKAVSTLNSIMDSFEREYRKANPQVENKKPQFFFYF